MYLLSLSWRAQDALWELLEDEDIDLLSLDAPDMRRARELMRKYRDLPMDLADAALVAVAERERIARTDPVTGFNTRRAVEEVLRGHAAGADARLGVIAEVLRGHAAGADARLGVIALELDTAGLPFERRDAAMAEAAERVRAVAGPGVVAGRTGAAELVVLLPGELSEPVGVTGERVRAALTSEPFSVGALGACVGVASARRTAARARSCSTPRSTPESWRGSWAATRCAAPATSRACRCWRRSPMPSTSAAPSPVTAVA
jgi:GGDEF domain-containing protein